jgi:hypothetical protein
MVHSGEQLWLGESTLHKTSYRRLETAVKTVHVTFLMISRSTSASLL